MDPLLGYYEKTWIVGLSGRRARFPPESWNQTDRVETDLNRTNNYCESFNKTFADVVGHSNPTIFNFLSAVQLEQASTESKISCYRQGRQPPKRRKRWIEKDASIKRMRTVCWSIWMNLPSCDWIYKYYICVIYYKCIYCYITIKFTANHLSLLGYY